jgi:hypothetical protein
LIMFVNVELPTCRLLDLGQANLATADIGHWPDASVLTSAA